MPLASAAMVGALLFAPTPSPTATALDVAVASTCDYLVISVYNPSHVPVKITPKSGPRAEPSVLVMPNETVPINLPARKNLKALLTVGDGARMGPWLWEPPAVCPQMGGAITDEQPGDSGGTSEAPVQEESGSSLGTAVFLIGLLLVFGGALGGLIPMLSGSRDPIDSDAPKVGRHRQAKPRRQIDVRQWCVQGWSFLRRLNGGRLKIHR